MGLDSLSVTMHCPHTAVYLLCFSRLSPLLPATTGPVLGSSLRQTSPSLLQLTAVAGELHIKARTNGLWRQGR